jgi:hypothetical protein
MATAADAPVPEVLAKEMALDRAQRRDERKALTSIPAADMAEAPQRTTFLPQSMGEAMQFAGLMARSNFVPMHLRGKDGDCMAIVMQAARWGMDPFAVANKSYFVKDGAPAAFESQLVNAVVNSSGALSGRLRIEFDGEGERLRCTVTGFLRADPNDPKVKTQSIARITTRNSPLWKADPQQQLAYYTTRAWARLWVPEVLMGVYTPDELDIDPERARVVSPPIPRRDAMPELSSGGYGREEEDEETARTLDNQTYAEREGRDDRDMGEGNNGTFADHPFRATADALITRAGSVELLADLTKVEADLAKDRDAAPEELVGEVEAAIAAARARFGKGAK